MNLTKALKQIKKLAAKANKEYAKFSAYNSREIKKVIPFDPEEAYNNWKRYTQELIELKAKVQKANQPIYEKIFRLAEAKSEIANLRRVTTTIGMQDKNKGFGQGTTQVEYIAFMDVVQQEKWIEELEDEIETIQSEIEAFNAVTNI